MAVCDLCGENAGWFKSRHPLCVMRVENAQKAMRELELNGIMAGRGYADLDAEAKQLADTRHVRFDNVREALLQGANDAASKIALESPVSQEEYRRVFGVLQGWHIQDYLSTAAEFLKRQWFGLPRLDMSLILWQVLHGLMPVYDGTGRMQFNLHPGEQPIFTAGKVTFAEERTVSTHTRTYGGLSIPVGAGIYYHVGASQGQQVSGLLPLDIGEMLITTHALYFGGQKTTLRIQLDSVLRYQSYLDGVGVCEAHGAPKVFVPDYSGMDTGWFFFNLLSALTARGGAGRG